MNNKTDEMKEILLRFRNEICINSYIGEHEDLLELIEEKIDDFENKS